MQMSAEATSRQDVEALAWTRAQLGNLYLLQGRLDDAEREFNHADFAFPAHPYAMSGRVRLALAERAAGERQDVVTMDALAWSYFRAGRVSDAAGAMRRATRLGTVDPRIRCHASAIASALSTSSAATEMVCDPLNPQG